MKFLYLAALCLLASLPAFVAQTPQEPRSQSLGAEIQAQLKLISANQSKIDEKIALISEEMRLAKIYASRGGSK